MYDSFVYVGCVSNIYYGRGTGTTKSMWFNVSARSNPISIEGFYFESAELWPKTLHVEIFKYRGGYTVRSLFFACSELNMNVFGFLLELWSNMCRKDVSREANFPFTEIDMLKCLASKTVSFDNRLVRLWHKPEASRSYNRFGGMKIHFTGNHS